MKYASIMKTKLKCKLKCINMTNKRYFKLKFKEIFVHNSDASVTYQLICVLYNINIFCYRFHHTAVAIFRYPRKNLSNSYNPVNIDNSFNDTSMMIPLKYTVQI